MRLKRFAVLALISLLLFSTAFAVLGSAGTVAATEPILRTGNTYVITFEDDTSGQKPANGTWYSWDYSAFGGIKVSDTTVYDGNNALHFPEPSAEQDLKFTFNLTNVTEISWEIYWDETPELLGVSMGNSTSYCVHLEVPSRYNADASSHGAAHYDGTWHTIKTPSGEAITFNSPTKTWVQFKIDINWSAQTYTVTWNGVTSAAIPFNRPVSEDDFSIFNLHSNQNYNTQFYIDNITFVTGGDNGGGNQDENTISWSSVMNMPSSDPQGLGFDGTYWYQGTGGSNIYVVDTSGNTVRTLSMPTDHSVGLKSLGNTLVVVGWNDAEFLFVDKSTWDIIKTEPTTLFGDADYSSSTQIARYTNTTNVMFAIKWKNDTHWFEFTVYALQFFEDYSYTTLNYYHTNISSYETDGLSAVAQGIAWDSHRGILWYITGWYAHNNAKLWALKLNSDHTIDVLHVWDISSEWGSSEPQGLEISQDCNSLYTMKTGSTTLYKIDISNVNLTGNWDLGITPVEEEQQYTVTFYTNVTGATITVNGQTYSNGEQADFTNGTYTVTANPPDGYEFDHWVTVGITVDNPNSQTTTMTVNGCGGSLEAHFVPATEPHYTVTFQANGLNGSSWSVTIGENTYNSNTNTIVVSLPNGTYSYTVHPPDGYNATPSSGTFTVNGADLTVAITFTPIDSNETDDNTTDDTNDSSGGAGDTNNETSFFLRTIDIAGYKIPVWVLIAVAVLLLIIIARR